MQQSKTYPPDVTQRIQQYGAALLPFSTIATLLQIKPEELAQHEQDFYTEGAPLFVAYWRGDAEYLANLSNAQMTSIFAQFAAPAPEAKDKDKQQRPKTLDGAAVRQQNAMRTANREQYERERRRWQLENTEQE